MKVETHLDKPKERARSSRGCDECFEQLAEISSECYWEQDERYRFTRLAGRLSELSGIDPRQLMGGALWNRGAQPAGGDNSWALHKQTLEARRPFSDFVFKLVNSKGELRYISSSGHPVLDRDGRFRGYRGTARDVTERVQKDVRLALEHAVTRVLESSGSIAEASPRILRVICEALDWACGARWVPDEGGEAIRCAETWGVGSAGIEAFLEATRRQAPSTQPGGLNRRVWTERKPMWIRDVTQEKTFRRATDAVTAGLRSAFAFPIKAGAQVIGVMEFFSREIHQPDAELLDCMTYVGSQIGQFVQRTRAEEELREGQARFRSLTELSSDFYWETDREHRVARNGGAQHSPIVPLGFVLGKARWELPSTRPDAAGWAAHRADMDAHRPFRDFELARIDEHGIERHLSISGEPVFDSAGAFKGYRGVGKDITARKREERLLNLEHTVTRSLAETGTAAEALRAAIRAVCETAGWECGRYFRADEKANVLRYSEEWGVPDEAVQRYMEGLRAVAYAPGVGLAGRVWQSGKPVWVSDVTKDARVAQVALAHDTGMRGAFVFPLISEGKTIGVLGFNSRQVREPEERLLQSIHVIGSQIGQFLQRKQAEEVLQESEARFRSLTELSSDFYWETDAEHRLVQTRYDRRHRPLIPRGNRSGKRRWELPSTQPDAAGWAAHRATLEAHLPFRDFELARIDSDGVERHLSISGEPMFDAAGAFKGYRGIGKEITARKREEQLLNLEHAVTRCLSEADGASEALQSVIRAICESQGWECGRYYYADEKARLLRFGAAWGIADPAIERYIEKSRDGTFALDGEATSTKARVGQTGEPLWSSEISRRRGLAKSILGSARDGFAFAVTSNGKVLGVMSFTSRAIRMPEQRLLQTARVIGSQIGQFLQRKQAEEVVRDSEARFRSLTQLSSDTYWEQDEELRFTVLTGPGLEKMDSKKFLAIGKKRWELGFLNMSQADWAAHIALLAARKPFMDLELCRLNDSGKKVWVSISGEPVFDAAGVFKGYRGVGKDITGRKLDEERIQYLANHDALTGLPNRAMFSEVLNLAIHNARRYQRSFAVLFVDLDRFKIINDTLGHEAGDRLLKEMGERLKSTVRTSDVVARFGGDEFVVLVQEVAEQKQVETVARKIMSALIKPTFILGQEYRVTASIGICMYPADAQDEQTLMKNADIAMYHAKEEGKNTYKFYRAQTNVHSFEKLALETSLRRGLERNEFFLHYQAKLDLHSGEITGVEALVRWQHPELGVVPPGQFIPLAEETGLIVPMGKWVLNTACQQNVAWQRDGLPPVRISVNISARQFADEDLLKDIAQALEQSTMKPELLELEITESMVMRNPEGAAEILSAIKQMGVRLAIDDFGVGYSSLTHLKRFPIDTLKVDRSFIRDLPQDVEDKAITEAIIAMGKSLHLTVVAEGVETLEQQTFLKNHDCDEAQGFYFSKPIPPAQFAELLRKRIIDRAGA